MRGLKRFIRLPLTLDARVASFTDAWIETVDESAQTMTVTSHLLQMRGLKRCREQYLKTRVEVASFTDAWIET